jgi:hypothetical protein
MTRLEAERERARLSGEHADSTWLIQEGEDGSWSVLRVGLPRRGSEELTAETQAAERPPYPDDPRPNQWRDAPYGSA